MRPSKPPSEFVANGTVTSIDRVGKSRGRVAVFVDGAHCFELDSTFAAERAIRKGDRMTLEAAQALWDEDQRRAALERALHFLSYRGRTVAEVRRKLSGLGFGEVPTDAAVSRLRELGYLDDHAFAAQYVRSRLNRKSFGPRRIAMDLRKLGLNSALIDATLNEVGNEEDVSEAAIRAGRKYWRRVVREPDPRKRRWKFVQYLVRRGFAGDVARSAFDVVREEADAELR